MKTSLGVLFVLAMLTGAAAAEPPVKAEPFAQAPELFPILPWDVLHVAQRPLGKGENGLESIAECGFTVGGFVEEQDLPACEKLGLTAIMASSQDWTKVRDEEVDPLVKKMVGPTAGNRTVLGYFIMDEPGVNSFATLGKVVAAVKKYAPGKLAYINLFPSYATTGAPGQSQLGTATYTEYLERYVDEVKPQFISYDDYMVQYSDDMKEAGQAAIYYADLLEVRRVSQKHGLPFWNIVGCARIQPQASVPSPANLAFQAFTTLAAGGRGVTWYKYYPDGYTYAPIDGAGEKTRTWEHLKAVNRQVKVIGPITNRLRSTGVFFTSPPPVKSLPLLPGRVVKTISAKGAGAAGAEAPLMVGEFADDKGADYVMAVNLSLERSTNFELETAKPYKVRQVFSSENGRLSQLEEKNGHELPAGQGVLVKLE